VPKTRQQISATSRPTPKFTFDGDMWEKHCCLWPPYVIGQAIIFLPCGFYLSSIFFSSPNLLASLGHPCTFQWVSRLGSVTARHSSSGRQPNFAALNRGRHLHSAGRPSRWALAHTITSFFPIVDTCLSCEDIANKVVRWCPDVEFLAIFACAAHFRPAF